MSTPTSDSLYDPPEVWEPEGVVTLLVSRSDWHGHAEVELELEVDLQARTEGKVISACSYNEAGSTTDLEVAQGLTEPLSGDEQQSAVERLADEEPDDGPEWDEGEDR